MSPSKSDQTDTRQQALLDAALARKDGALAPLLESYRERLLAKAQKKLAFHYIPGKSGRDVVQTVYAKAIQHFDQFRGTTCAQLDAWLHRILIREVANIKKTASNSLHILSKDQVKERVTPQPSPSSQSRRHESADRLRRLIVQMPEPYRSVVIQRYVEGIESFADIATSLGRKEGTVRQQWLRGLKWLKEVEGMKEIH
jgi:RNA polymerase sigma factor (sigma-70 family)